MNGLVVKSPYIDDILSGIKQWELRGSNTKIRGTIVLLKSGSGTALGTVDIVDSKEITLDEYNNWSYRKDANMLKADTLPYKKTYAYILKNPVLFKEPIPYKHPAGAITWVKLPDDFLFYDRRHRKAEKAVFTNMCMIQDGEKVVVQNRVKGWNGYVFPGGHLEPKETVTESVVREIKEETGLIVSNLKLCGIKQWFNEDEGRNVCFLFKTSTFEGELNSSDEGDIFWMNLEDLKVSDKVAYNFDMMLKVFLEDNINEMYVPDDGTENFLL